MIRTWCFLSTGRYKLDASDWGTLFIPVPRSSRKLSERDKTQCRQPVESGACRVTAAVVNDCCSGSKTCKGVEAKKRYSIAWYLAWYSSVHSASKPAVWSCTREREREGDGWSSMCDRPNPAGDRPTVTPMPKTSLHSRTC